MQLCKLLHSVRHTRPRQLYHRLRLIGRRWLAVRRAQASRRRLLARPLPELRLRAELPTPILPRRRGRLVRAGDRYELTLLNHTRSFVGAIDWHPRELETGTRLWLLNLHYMEYLEEASDADFEVLVDAWIDACPPYRAGYWLDDWNSFALSIRCVVWMQQLAARQGRLGAGFVAKAQVSLVRQLRFLAANIELDIGGNHLIKNIKALLWGAAFFAVPESSRWSALGRRLLAAALAEQLLGDGMHFERSPAYHAQVFADLLECYRCLAPAALRERLARRLDRAAQALADMTHPDGSPSLFNDGGLHMSYPPGICLAAWEALGGRAPRPRAIFALREAGYFGARSGGDLVVVDCGPIAPDYLPAHGHGDILGFEWSVDGRRLIVDAGTYEYNPGLRRSYSRSTRAHNTLTLDDQDQCEFWGAFRVARRARPRLIRYQPTAAGFLLEGDHDGYRRLAGAPIHRRRFAVTPSSIRVVDEVRGGGGQRAVARLLLHPECVVEERPDGRLIRLGDTCVALATTAAIKTEAAPWFPDFGEERATTQLVLDYGRAPVRGEFSLRKISGDARPQ